MLYHVPGPAPTLGFTSKTTLIMRLRTGQDLADLDLAVGSIGCYRQPGVPSYFNASLYRVGCFAVGANVTKLGRILGHSWYGDAD